MLHLSLPFDMEAIIAQVKLQRLKSTSEQPKSPLPLPAATTHSAIAKTPKPDLKLQKEKVEPMVIPPEAIDVETFGLKIGVVSCSDL